MGKDTVENAKDTTNKAVQDVKDKAQNKVEDVKQKVSGEASHIDKTVDAAFDKARDLEKATRTPSKTNMILFATVGGALGALASSLLTRNAAPLTRILTASAGAGGGAYLGSHYSRVDVTNAALNMKQGSSKWRVQIQIMSVLILQKN